MFTRQARENEAAWLKNTLKETGVETDTLNPTNYIFVLKEKQNTPLGGAKVTQTNETEQIVISNIFIYGENTQNIRSKLLSGIFKHIQNIETKTIYLLTENPETYSSYGFSPSDSIPPSLQSVVSDSKELIQTTINQFSPPTVTPPKVNDIEREKELLGFTNTEELTYKYSTSPNDAHEE